MICIYRCSFMHFWIPLVVLLSQWLYLSTWPNINRWPSVLLLTWGSIVCVFFKVDSKMLSLRWYLKVFFISSAPAFHVRLDRDFYSAVSLKPFFSSYARNTDENVKYLKSLSYKKMRYELIPWLIIFFMDVMGNINKSNFRVVQFT